MGREQVRTPRFCMQIILANESRKKHLDYQACWYKDAKSSYNLVGLSRGRGIRCYDNLSEILDHVKVKESVVLTIEPCNLTGFFCYSEQIDEFGTL